MAAFPWWSNPFIISVFTFGSQDPGSKARRRCEKAFGDYLLSFIEGKSDLLFKMKKGTPLRAGNLHRRCLDKRFDDFGFHSFRRFRITLLEAARAHGHLFAKA